METILNDDKQGILTSNIQTSSYTCFTEHDPLYYLVYERTPVAKGSLEPHLWGYRPRITLEHLTRYMQQQKKKFPILEEFLKSVCSSTLCWFLVCYTCDHNRRQCCRLLSTSQT